MISTAVIFLSILGAWISLYFTGVTYHWFQPNVFWIPQVCRLEEKTCLLVLETPRAKLFGVPNSVFGMGLFLYLIFDQFFFSDIPGLFFLGLAVLRSIYLAHSLMFVTKVPCVLCFTSHGINLLLFAGYGFRLWKG